MEKIKDFNEALYYLKEGAVLTSDGINMIIRRRQHYCITSNGSSYTLDEATFTELFKDCNLYCYEDTGAEIDLNKDEDYYRYYRK